ncbi:hypothetical protein [Bacillus paralicheniformis]|uniref:hypothetical protein n=1 Tax=Bacillus paralicheniformis TaxID=1648923 RepID=UPI0011A1B229|nr:hypothetical protein [Bacillus paralicheniformis]
MENCCNCRQCQGNPDIPKETVYEDKLVSVYDRLRELHSRLKAHRIPDELLEEVDDLIETVSNIDDELLHLRGTVTRSYHYRKLTEISEELFQGRG